METHVQDDTSSFFEPPYYPTAGQAWAVILWYILASIVCCIPAIPLMLKFPAQQLPILLAASMLADLSLIFFLAWKKRRQREPGFRPHFRKVSPGLLLACIPATLALILLEDPLNFLHLPDWAEDIFAQLGNTPGIFILFVTIVGPVMEEIIFRGIVLDGLLKNYKPKFSILISSAVFAIIHMNPAQTASAFIAGLLLGWVYYRTRSLWPCICIHIINNGLFTALSLLFPSVKTSDSLWQLIDHKSYYFAAMLAALLIMWLFVTLLNKKSTSPENKLPAMVDAPFTEEEHE